MPATETIALTRCQRRLACLREWGLDACACITILTVISGFFGIIALTVIEGLAQFGPDLCFERTQDCEVVAVTHVYNVSDLTCTDSFVYAWKFFESPVLFEQVERRRRADAECLLDLDLSEQNATFRVGNSSNTCFRVLPVFAIYAEFFNCAPVLDSKNATVGPCQTLFPPESSYDASLLFVLMCSFVFFCLYEICLCCTVGDGIEEEVLEDMQQQLAELQQQVNALEEELGNAEDKEEGQGEEEEEEGVEEEEEQVEEEEGEEEIEDSKEDEDEEQGSAQP